PVPCTAARMIEFFDGRWIPTLLFSRIVYVLKSPAGITTVPPPAAAAASIALLIAAWFARAGPPDTAPNAVMSKNGPCGSGVVLTPLPVASGIFGGAAPAGKPQHKLPANTNAIARARIFISRPPRRPGQRTQPLLDRDLIHHRVYVEAVEKIDRYVMAVDIPALIVVQRDDIARERTIGA